MKKYSGAAIIVALFVTALVAAAAVAMITRLRIDVRRTELLINNQQAELYAQGSLYWAIDQLNNDWNKKQPNQVIDKTPITSPTKTMGNAKITSIIYDAQGRFNLNNLKDNSYRENFLHLLQTAVPNLPTNEAQTILVAAIEWLSPPTMASPFTEYYAKQNPPYRAAHRLFFSMSELRLVKGMTPAIFAAIEPLIIALPETTTININNAPASVLRCLSPTLTEPAAKTILLYEKATPFATTQSFLNFAVVKNNPIPENKITTSSSYFLVQSDVEIGTQHVTLYTLLHRTLKNGKSTMVIVWQSKGTL